HEDEQASPKTGSEMPRKTLSSALLQHERAIDRTIEAIDTVVGELHNVVAHAGTKDRAPAQPGSQTVETARPRAVPTREQARPPPPPPRSGQRHRYPRLPSCLFWRRAAASPGKREWRPRP
ncbi:hypothetical protein, partial [Mesorhizobium sp. M4B.F.Ca.ET.019.03.1.1]|uniref:hypothetical protein n=1 Tax=Mesorhizobium sp. M4B.F.Ca.ET.019.03.1.1 TaxID=2496651 RepID=UPI001AED0C57